MLYFCLLFRGHRWCTVQFDGKVCSINYFFRSALEYLDLAIFGIMFVFFIYNNKYNVCCWTGIMYRSAIINYFMMKRGYLVWSKYIYCLLSFQWDRYSSEIGRLDIYVPSLWGHFLRYIWFEWRWWAKKPTLLGICSLSCIPVVSFITEATLDY